MPTGYTAAVEDGTVTDFRTFALRCARAFGACIMQREDSLEVLPEPRKESTYALEALDRARTRRDMLEQMPPAEAEIEAQRQYDDAVKRITEGKARRELELARYAKMLTAVQAWMPPTPDHQGLKDFMVQQITESTRYMNGKWDMPKRLTGAEWIIVERAKAYRDVAYYAEEAQKERERVDESHAWLAALVKSLPGNGVTGGAFSPPQRKDP